MCVSLKIHYIIYWHGIEVLPQHLLLSAHGAHAVCQMCWIRPSVRPPPVGIFCNICDCLAATAGSSRCLNRCLCHRHLTCCQSKCLWRTLHASQRLAGCKQHGHFVASAKRFIQMNSEMTLQLTAWHIAKTPRSPPAQRDQPSPVLAWPGLQGDCNIDFLEHIKKQILFIEAAGQGECKAKSPFQKWSLSHDKLSSIKLSNLTECWQWKLQFYRAHSNIVRT